MADRSRVWVRGRDGCFQLHFGHGLGLGLHERPIISRLNSIREPVELQTGMVFALETYCPASDGFSAARIEEEVVVTRDGPSMTLSRLKILLWPTPTDFRRCFVRGGKVTQTMAGGTGDLLTDLFIGGAAVPASDGGRFDVFDPATGEVVVCLQWHNR